MSEKNRSAIDAIAAGLEVDPDSEEHAELEEGEELDHSLTQLFLGEDSVEVKISHTVTVAGKDHYVGTNTCFRALPGENQYALGERVADFALEFNFAVAEQYRSMKLAEIAARKSAATNPSNEK